MTCCAMGKYRKLHPTVNAVTCQGVMEQEATEITEAAGPPAKSELSLR